MDFALIDRSSVLLLHRYRASIDTLLLIESSFAVRLDRDAEITRSQCLDALATLQCLTKNIPMNKTTNVQHRQHRCDAKTDPEIN